MVLGVRKPYGKVLGTSDSVFHLHAFDSVVVEETQLSANLRQSVEQFLKYFLRPISNIVSSQLDNVL